MGRREGSGWQCKGLGLPYVGTAGGGSLLGILKVEALGSKFYVDLGLEVSPTTLEGCLITGSCHR